MNFKKDHWRSLAWQRALALKNIAVMLGEDHPVTKLMGSNAWGRCNAETSASSCGLQAQIRHASYLDGVRDTLVAWASEHDGKAFRLICDTYPYGYVLSKRKTP